MSVYVGAFRYLCRMWLKTKAKHQYTHQIEEDKKCTQPYGVCKKNDKTPEAHGMLARHKHKHVRSLFVLCMCVDFCLTYSVCSSMRLDRLASVIYVWAVQCVTTPRNSFDRYESYIKRNPIHQLHSLPIHLNFGKFSMEFPVVFFSYTVFSILSNRISKWTVPINGDETNRFQCIYENISVIMWQYTRCFAVNLISYYNVNEPFTYFKLKLCSGKISEASFDVTKLELW